MACKDCLHLTWEYKVENISPYNLNSKWLDGFGVKGWELVAIDDSPFTGKKVVYLKRPIFL